MDYCVEDRGVKDCEGQKGVSMSEAKELGHDRAAWRTFVNIEQKRLKELTIQCKIRYFSW